MNRLYGFFLCITSTALLTGCGAMRPVRTVIVPGLPAVEASRVKLVENLEKVAQPYQLVGGVYVERNARAVSKATADALLQQGAAGMGADGVIGVHRTPGFVSGLAVKWQTTEPAPVPVDVPFVVAIMPLSADPQARGNQARIREEMRMALLFALEPKGYYLLPDDAVRFSGDLDAARKLGDAELLALGGRNAHLLMELAFVSRSEVNTGVVAFSSAKLRVRLLDKRTRQIVYEGWGEGGGGGLFATSGGLLATLVAPDEKRVEAATRSIWTAFKNLQPISR